MQMECEGNKREKAATRRDKREKEEVHSAVMKNRGVFLRLTGERYKKYEYAFVCLSQDADQS